MAVDTTAETQTMNQKESIFNRRISRRAVLAAGVVGAAAGGLALVESQTGVISKAAESVGILSKEKEQSVFNKVRAAINSAAGTEELRAKLLGRLDEYERVNRILEGIRYAHEKKFVEADGTPTLVAQTRARLFGKADTTPFWQGKFASEREFIEDKVEILRPLRHQKVLIGDFLSEIASNPDRANLSSFTPLLDPKLKRSDIGPGMLGYRQASEFEMAFRTVVEIGTEVPREGVITVKPVSEVPSQGMVAYEADKNQVLSRIANLPFPEDINVVLAAPNRYKNGKLDANVQNWDGAGGTIYRDDDGKLVLSLKVGEETGYMAADLAAAEHEAGHYFMDHVKRFLNGEQVVVYEILMERVLSDSKIGRNYPELELLFSSRKLKSPSQVSHVELPYSKVETPEDFRYVTGGYADKIWLLQVRRDPLAGDKGVFGDFLDADLIDQYSAEKPPADFYPFKTADFLSLVDPKKLNEFALRSRAGEIVISEMRKDPKKFDNHHWVGFLAGIRVGKVGILPDFSAKATPATRYSTGWKSLNTFGQAILGDQFVEGNPVVLKMIAEASENVRKRFVDVWINLNNVCDEEKWAETFALAISHPELVPGDVTSFNQFRVRLNEFMKPKPGST